MGSHQQFLHDKLNILSTFNSAPQSNCILANSEQLCVKKGWSFRWSEYQTHLAYDNLAGTEKNEEEEGEEDAASAHGCLSHYERDCAPAGVRLAPSWARPAADCCCGSSSL